MLAIGPAQAAKCHIYSIWRYPKPQKCFTAYANKPVFSLEKPVFSYAKPASRVPETSQERIEPVREQRIEIPIPDMKWTPCPDADERWLGIAKLRALGDGH
jgi:hypothetical protein